MKTDIQIGLNAAIVAVEALTPKILIVSSAEGDALPFGPFDPVSHRTLEIGLRSWVEAQTSLTLGYVEQLYTFGDRGRHARAGDKGPHIMSVGYLALARPPERAAGAAERTEVVWRDWYNYFPWEDWRKGRPALIDGVIGPRLEKWSALRPDDARPLRRPERVQLAIGQDDAPWDEERVLDRFELL